MKWKFTIINDVVTFDTIYFDEEFKETCASICETLYIDCFPDINSLTYKRIDNNEWITKSIPYNLDNIEGAFDSNLLKLFSNNDSNIIFYLDNEMVKGVIHFTNYENSIVYSNLYHNLNVFEKQLREYFISNGLKDSDFLNYLETYKLHASRQKFKERVLVRIKQLRNSKDKRPFENTYLSELMEFGVSGFLNEETSQKLDLKFLKQKLNFSNGKSSQLFQVINELRNFVMHHDNISGESKFTPHNFVEFQHFFELVNHFHFSFDKLSARINILKKEKLNRINQKKLAFISKLSKKEVKDYFYELI